MDTFDRVQRDDMIPQATVIAVFAYTAAMRDEPLQNASSNPLFRSDLRDWGQAP